MATLVVPLQFPLIGGKNPLCFYRVISNTVPSVWP